MVWYNKGRGKQSFSRSIIQIFVCDECMKFNNNNKKNAALLIDTVMYFICNVYQSKLGLFQRTFY